MATGKGILLALLLTLAVAFVTSPIGPPQAQAQGDTLVQRLDVAGEGFKPVFQVSAPAPLAEAAAAQPTASPEATPTPEATGKGRSRLGLVLIAVGTGVALAGVLILLLLGGWRQRSS